MPMDPYAALQALLRAEAVRATPPEEPRPAPQAPLEHDDHAPEHHRRQQPNDA
ncbi:hypothetical protein ABZV77_26100 [Streptomyces sp. NPDC004732]|uniref:hypothetical protein n=1 Tax=Streptomyces sp. NPDC004732 TaxID=3154290 RepID=UPI0033B07113